MSGKPRRNFLWEALELAKRHGARIVTVQERIDRTQPERDGNLAPAWVVYHRGVRQGRRKDPAALLRFLKRIVS